jgi:hypothetical protein
MSAAQPFGAGIDSAKSRRKVDEKSTGWNVPQSSNRCQKEPMMSHDQPQATSRRWSQQVTDHSDALDLEEGVFTKQNPQEIALSLKRSAESSERRKSSPYRSAMSMLTFYINRAGDQLSEERRQTLEQAKQELRHLYGRA